MAFCRTCGVMRRSSKLMTKIFTLFFISCGVVMTLNKGMVWIQTIDSTNSMRENLDKGHDSAMIQSQKTQHVTVRKVAEDVQKPVLLQGGYRDMAEKRMERHKASCKGRWTDTFHLNKKNNSYVFYDDDVRLGYCFIAKVGCTFWLRMLSFLTRRDEMAKLGIKTPFDIDRSSLHVGKLGPTRWHYLNNFKKVVKPTTTKFLFTRNPYERLWSVYLDKYYLIDYWVTNPIARSKCGAYVTFEKFLRHAVKSTDHHLVSVSKACQPCAFKPNFIGSMETFTKDSKYLLKQAGYTHLLDGFNHSLYVETELKSLIVYNFNAMKYPTFAGGKCITKKMLCQRLWHVFQQNGLIKGSIQFPKDLEDYSVEPAIQFFLETVRENPITKDESRQQRRDAIVRAYSDIKWKTITDIQERYREDFEMFGFDINPPS